jgi:hypothetical protein
MRSPPPGVSVCPRMRTGSMRARSR